MFFQLISKSRCKFDSGLFQPILGLEPSKDLDRRGLLLGASNKDQTSKKTFEVDYRLILAPKWGGITNTQLKFSASYTMAHSMRLHPFWFISSNLLVIVLCTQNSVKRLHLVSAVHMFSKVRFPLVRVATFLFLVKECKKDKGTKNFGSPGR